MTILLHGFKFSHVLLAEFYVIYLVSGNLPVFLNLTDQCYGIIDNAELKIYGRRGLVECQEGYDLEGSPNINCIDGNWRPRPRCIPRCTFPPGLMNGNVTINDEKDFRGFFRKGTLATYICYEGYHLIPAESKLRVCEEGIWTGADAKCSKNDEFLKGCERPQEVTNGYYVSEKHGQIDPFGVGQRVHYSCKEGFILEGSSVQQCLENRDWSPKIQPICWKPTTELELPCGEIPFVAYSVVTVIKGREADGSADPGTVIEIRCESTFHDVFARHIVGTCQPAKLTCIGGKWRWIGEKLDCGPNVGCPSPPSVNYGTFSLVSGYKTSVGFSSKSQVSYKCLPDYILEGNGILNCLEGGCWFPSIPPSCISANYYSDYNTLNAFLISIVTGAVVLSSLLVICLLVFYRRKRQMRDIALPPPVQGPDLGDHAILLRQPDRLALIAFAEGQRNSLPTYDEAVRDRPPNYTSSGRLPPRPQWQHITVRRSRNSPNSDLIHSGRHGSFVSHTPSTRSVVDSMGSTDTMAISENSTNVTLDTVSSHSGSQAPSCRAHCGSLASFDTSSVIITEDVPLLEESELEEVSGCNAISIQDRASQKISASNAEGS